jgi:uncharacterized protein with PhoU and TrkA domain
LSADDPQIEHDEDAADDASAALEDALARSRQHARSALSESVSCLRALLEAASLASSGMPAEVHSLLRQLASALGQAADGLAPDVDSNEVIGAVAAALDEEIMRWEVRAEADPDARAVLRAFLGVREILWELGIRRDRGTRARGPSVARPRERVQRVHVQGPPPSA